MYIFIILLCMNELKHMYIYPYYFLIDLIVHRSIYDIFTKREKPELVDFGERKNLCSIPLLSIDIPFDSSSDLSPKISPFLPYSPVGQTEGRTDRRK